MYAAVWSGGAGKVVHCKSGQEGRGQMYTASLVRRGGDRCTLQVWSGGAGTDVHCKSVQSIGVLQVCRIDVLCQLDTRFLYRVGTSACVKKLVQIVQGL